MRVCEFFLKECNFPGQSGRHEIPHFFVWTFSVWGLWLHRQLLRNTNAVQSASCRTQAQRERGSCSKRVDKHFHLDTLACSLREVYLDQQQVGFLQRLLSLSFWLNTGKQDWPSGGQVSPRMTQFSEAEGQGVVSFGSAREPSQAPRCLAAPKWEQQRPEPEPAGSAPAWSRHQLPSNTPAQ